MTAIVRYHHIPYADVSYEGIERNSHRQQIVR